MQVDIINKNVNNITLMKYSELKSLETRLYFTSQHVADVLGIKPSSAIVLCTRYVKKGLFIRLKKDFYVMKERWQRNSSSEFFQIANILQVPSYISLMTALSFYEITTQVQSSGSVTDLIDFLLILIFGFIKRLIQKNTLAS